MTLVAGKISFINNVAESVVIFAPLPGRTTGMRAVDSDYGVGIYVPNGANAGDEILLDELGNPILDELGDYIVLDGDFEDIPVIVVQSAVHAGTPAGPPHTTGNLVSEHIAERKDFNTGQDWFEKIHIFPNSTSNTYRTEGYQIDFGNILAQVDDVYEIYNAFRRSSTTLINIVNNTLPGTDTVNVAAPMTIRAQHSLLDITSTFNYQGTSGLGTLVRTKIRAFADGAPAFDDTVDFFFDVGNEVQLPLLGQRISLLTIPFGMPLVEGMDFLTDIIEALSGKEQRIALRKQPREWWRVLYEVESDERQRLQAIMFSWQDKVFGLPLWHEQILLTAAASIGATSFTVAHADQVDFRVGGYMVLLTDYATFDVLKIATVSASTITTVSGAQYGYSANTLVMPVRVVRITKKPAITAHQVKREDFTLEFETMDSTTGAPSASTAWIASTYNGKVLLDDPNIISGTMQESMDKRIYVIDNGTGNVTQSSQWAKNKREHAKGFVAKNRNDIQKLKNLLRHMAGRQKSFYIPTFMEDMNVVASLAIGTATMDITNIGYVRYIQNRSPKNVFRVTFTDGTSLVREVQSSVAVSGTVERLTLDTTWPANRTTAEISRVQFYEPVRFDTDKFTINYPRIGLAKVTAPVKVVFDD